MSYNSKIFTDGEVLNAADLNNIIDGVDKAINDISSLIEESTHNLLDLSTLYFNVRYSTGSAKIISDTSLPIALTEMVAVKEGEWYTVSGVGFYGMTSSAPQGGYFTEDATIKPNQAAIENIVFTKPVTGDGMCFQVPLGKNIKYVVFNLKSNADKTEIENPEVQLEEGEMATSYEPYGIKRTIKSEFLPNFSNSSLNNDKLEKYTDLSNLNYYPTENKFSKFKSHWLNKDKNLCIINTGTSLTARSSEHCTTRVDANKRPPLLHSNNFASYIWDALCWEGQQYRRFDYPSFFIEEGAFVNASNIEDWDDGPYRYGITRYTDGVGKITFNVPTTAWQFNFIYRTDSKGAENCVVKVAEGDGHMLVLNEQNEWVEANGYVFSQREVDALYLDKIDYINPANLNPASIEQYQVKGNTTYQKRLYMKSVKRGSEKTISIENASGRLSYWGVEWSPREYMITYINAARGSHSSGISTAATALNHYQDNEIWSFKPDLFLTEDPIHNAGAAGAPNASVGHKDYYGTISDNFFFADNGISMKSRCKTLGLEEPEWIIFNSTLTYNFNGFDKETGELLTTEMKDGLTWTGLDSQMSCYRYISEKYPEVTYINATKGWVRAAKEVYGNLAAATIGSGKDGLTFTNEGSHWNDTGSKVMARQVLPVFNFIV